MSRQETQKASKLTWQTEISCFHKPFFFHFFSFRRIDCKTIWSLFKRVNKTGQDFFLNVATSHGRSLLYLAFTIKSYDGRVGSAFASRSKVCGFESHWFQI